MRRHEREESEDKKINRTRDRNFKPGGIKHRYHLPNRSVHRLRRPDAVAIAYLQQYRVTVVTSPGQKSAGQLARSTALGGLQIVTVSWSQSQIATTMQ